MIKKSTAKFVPTFDVNTKQRNGHLIELAKDGDKTTSYSTVAYPGCFKGYHLHKVRASNYVCISGVVNIIVAMKNSGLANYKLDSRKHEKIHIPPGYPTAISNEGSEPAVIINFPEPAYDPSLTDEQVDFDHNQVWEWIHEEEN